VKWDLDLKDKGNPETSSEAWYNSVGLVIPFKIKKMHFAAGMAMRSLYLWNDLRHLADEFDYNGSNYATGMAGAVNYRNKLMIGFAYYQVSGNINISDRQFMSVDLSTKLVDIAVLYKTSFNVNLGIKYSLVSDLKADIKDNSPSSGMFSWNFSGNHTITTPDFFNIGISYQPSKKLILAMDYHSEPWSKSKWENVKWLSEDVNSVHLGLEYNGWFFPIRFGFCTVPTVFQDDKNQQASYYSLNTGSGINIAKIQVDFSIEYLFGSSQLEYYTNESTFVKETLNEIRFGLSASYTF